MRFSDSRYAPNSERANYLQVSKTTRKEIEEEEPIVDPLEDLLSEEQEPSSKLKEVERQEQATETQQIVIEGQEEEERAEATTTEGSPKRRSRKTKSRATAITTTTTTTTPVAPTEKFEAERVEELAHQFAPSELSGATITNDTETDIPRLQVLPALPEVPEKLAECAEPHRLWEKVVLMMGGEFALSLWIPNQDEFRQTSKE